MQDPPSGYECAGPLGDAIRTGESLRGLVVLQCLPRTRRPNEVRHCRAQGGRGAAAPAGLPRATDHARWAGRIALAVEPAAGRRCAPEVTCLDLDAQRSDARGRRRPRAPTAALEGADWRRTGQRAAGPRIPPVGKSRVAL